MISFDELSGFFRENSKRAVDVAMETANLAKIKADIKTEEVRMAASFAEIGKLFYKQAKDSEVDEIFVPLMKKIAESKDKIAGLEAEIDKLKKTVTCPECGHKSPAGSKFCGACGIVLPEEKADEPVKEEEVCEACADEQEETCVLEKEMEAPEEIGAEEE